MGIENKCYSHLQQKKKSETNGNILSSSCTLQEENGQVPKILKTVYRDIIRKFQLWKKYWKNICVEFHSVNEQSKQELSAYYCLVYKGKELGPRTAPGPGLNCRALALVLSLARNPDFYRNYLIAIGFLLNHKMTAETMWHCAELTDYSRQRSQSLSHWLQSSHRQFPGCRPHNSPQNRCLHLHSSARPVLQRVPKQRNGPAIPLPTPRVIILSWNPAAASISERCWVEALEYRAWVKEDCLRLVLHTLCD